MSRPDIVQKLTNLIEGGVNDESKVVYLLAETRKLLETYPPPTPPLSLKLYCHWALHIDLTKPNTTLPLLRQIDEFIDSVYGSAKPDRHLENQTFHELRVLSTFRTELRGFLATYGIPVSLCDDDEQWRTFLRHYSGVIQDGTLSCEAAKAKDLKHVDSVVFKRGRMREWPDRCEAYLPFDLDWTVNLKDGNKLTVSTSARMSNDVFLTDSSLHLN